jgi:hypothetical protein
MEYWKQKVEDHMRYKKSYLHCFDGPGVTYFGNLAEVNKNNILTHVMVRHKGRGEKLIRDAAGDCWFLNGKTPKTEIQDQHLIRGLNQLYDEIQQKVQDNEYRPRIDCQLHLKK